jgi:predicted amidohydrolase YtcJ
MRARKILPLLLVAVLILSSFSGCGSSVDAADKVFTNGVIYTVDSADTIAEAVAIKDGVISFVGSTADAEAYIGKDTEVVDLAGKSMLPGFTDSHLHTPGTMIAQLFQIDLNGVLEEAATIQTITDFVKNNPDREIYYGSGFSIGAFSGEEVAKGPKKERLDAISDKPIILTSYDGHINWLNSAAFEYCGITKDTPAPAGGVIEKDSNGELWGTLKESAISLVKDQVFTDEDYKTAYVAFQDYLHTLGYVGITSMSSGITTDTNLDPFVQMDKDGELKMYITKNTVMQPDEDYVAQIEAAVANRDAYSSDLYKSTSLKFFADGVVEGVTGYLSKPYEAAAGQGTDFVSIPLWDPKVMNDAFAMGNAQGFQIHVHSIGDAATSQTLDAMQYSLDQNGEGDYRNVITHLQLVKPEDIQRFADLKVIANVQSYWAFKEPYWWDVVDQPLLGTERASKEYPLQSFIDAGVTLVGSSDHFVTPIPNPFWAIEVGVTRNLNNAEFYGVDDITSIDDPKWLLWPEERVSVKNMIKAFTINSAFQNFREDTTGSIEVGKSADLVVLDQDLLSINPIDIDKTTVLETIFRGETVYTAE